MVCLLQDSFFFFAAASGSPLFDDDSIPGCRTRLFFIFAAASGSPLFRQQGAPEIGVGRIGLGPGGLLITTMPCKLKRISSIDTE